MIKAVFQAAKLCLNPRKAKFKFNYIGYSLP